MFGKLFKPRASGTANPSQWLIDWVRGGTESDAGISVNAETVYKSGPFYQAVSIIAGDVAQLPLRVMTRDSTGDTQRAHDHPAHRLLSHQANSEMLSHTVIELLQTWALTWGNGVAAIIRDGTGPVELIPLLPDRTGIERAEDHQLWYWTKPDGNTEKKFIRPENVLHIKNLSGNGLWGRSVIDLARNTVGMEQALTTHGGRVFKNGAVPGGVLERPIDAPSLSPEGAKNVLKEWNALYGGADNTGKVALLREGTKFNPLSLSNVDAQWLEAMDRSREWVAAWFNLPPHKLGSMRDSSVRANLEQQNRDYLNGTLMGWLIRWEQECFAKLLTGQQQQTESHFFKFNTAALLRADLKTRFESYSIARTAGFMSANEIRLKEDMNRRTDAGGDSYDNPNTSSPLAVAPVPASTAAVLPEGGDPARNRTDPAKASTTEYSSAIVATCHRELLLDRARQTIATECHRVRKAARNGGNFLAWLDEFYDEQLGVIADGHLRQTVVACESVGLDVPRGALEPAIESHIRESFRQLVELTGVCTADTLAADVTDLVSSWHTRSETLVNQLLPVEVTNAAA